MKLITSTYTISSFLALIYQQCNVMPFIYDITAFCLNEGGCNSWSMTVNFGWHIKKVGIILASILLNTILVSTKIIKLTDFMHGVGLMIGVMFKIVVDYRPDTLYYS